MSGTLAIYPGSFDPPTLGHIDIIERAARLYDRVIVAIGSNPSKNCLLSVEQRKETLAATLSHLKNIHLSFFEGLLVNYAKEVKAHVIIRGLRATSDFDYEFKIAMANRSLSPDIETVFLMAKAEYSFITSSTIREVISFGGDYSSFVSPQVKEKIQEFLGHCSS